MDGNRVIYAQYGNPIKKTTTHPSGSLTVDTEQYEVYLHEGTGNHNEYWYFDEEANAIRNVANSRFVLGMDNMRTNNNQPVLATTQRRSQTRYDWERSGLRYEKDTYRVIRLDNGWCLSIADAVAPNNEERRVAWKSCNAGDKSQTWYPWYRF